MNSRRDFVLGSMALAGSTTALYAAPPAESEPVTEATAAPKADAVAAQHAEQMKQLRPDWFGHEQIAMVLYPEFTALDLFGPHHWFISLMGAKVHLVAKTLGPVLTDSKVAVQPTCTFADCPTNLTILFVPGGTRGTMQAIADPELREFVKQRGTNATWVTSVCTGSLLLAAAGLLTGYRATSHWLTLSHLEILGAIPVDQRVVIDRNRITGAGVTSGLDFGLHIVQQLRGTEYAQAVQLLSEYAPQPPLQAGDIHQAPAPVVQMMRQMHSQLDETFRQTLLKLKTQ